jgi:hypothetical protein
MSTLKNMVESGNSDGTQIGQISEFDTPELQIVEQVCKDFDGNWIFSVGAIGALPAMAYEDSVHPWDGRAGFDVLILDFDTVTQRDTAVLIAEGKFWKPWIVGFNLDENGHVSSVPSAVLYKPSGIMKDWNDSPENPHPGCIKGVEIKPETQYLRERS